MRTYATSATSRSWVIGILINLMLWVTAAWWILSCIGDVRALRSWPFLLLGSIAAWRYVWVGLHFCRSLWYQYAAFPHLRKKATAGGASQIYAVVLSWKMEPQVNAMVYTAIAEAIHNYGCRGTMVACISDDVDIRVLEMLRLPPNVRVEVIRQSGRGKRDAMEQALAFLANNCDTDNDYVALIDGDSVVPPDVFGRTVPLLAANPKIGALTTNNAPAVWGNDLIRQWYWLRMQHRHILMCSLSLSRKVLVLTGRFSLFRADVALSWPFILQVGRDSIKHWRFGRIRMLTGDDKSTWFAVLKAGWEMLYVPDVNVVCLEKPVARNLVAATVPLMVRYFGNMARNNGRAMRLGPSRVGWFLWWALLDQRLSPWTTLLGPTVALAATVLWRADAMLAYLCWAILTRTIQSCFIGAVCRRFHPYMVWLLIYNQVVGASVKIFTFFHLDKQKWTRQNTGRGAVRGKLSPLLMGEVIAVVALTVLLCVIVGK